MAEFDAFTALVESPVYVVTTAVGGKRAGCLVGFAGQCSLKPARFVVWLSKANHTYLLAREAEVLVVHLLPGRHDLAAHFGALCGAEVDKFADVPWSEGPDKAPVLTDALAWFAGRIHHRVDGGDHVAFLLDPITTHAPHTSTGTTPPLSLHDTLDITAGHPA
ncbi:flavin reductase family protein [Streptomyces sp. NPDC058231]|uniref:flavin reductase family protein n=1 Tax=Streptomyces sp. NPDC058231 TaxID=3346392 RepID=UPI0036E710A4